MPMTAKKLATPLNELTATQIVRAIAEGEAIRAGTIYVAPGGRHMTVAPGDQGPVIRITDDPPVNFCKPPSAAMRSAVGRNIK